MANGSTFLRAVANGSGTAAEGTPKNRRDTGASQRLQAQPRKSWKAGKEQKRRQKLYGKGEKWKSVKKSTKSGKKAGSVATTVWQGAKMRKKEPKATAVR
jgi:hypothetical protein